VGVARLIRLGDQKLVPPDSLDLRIVASALGQDGVIGRAELAALGATDEMIQHRVATGRLFRIHRGVYSIVPPSMLSRNGRYRAAFLACGSDALVSHRCAAALVGLRNTPNGPVHVTVPRRGSPTHAGLRVHSSRCLHPADREEVDGIPCTSWARTLVDLSATETDRALARMVEKALILQIYDHTAMRAALERSNGRAGPRQLRRILADLIDDQPYITSEFHRDLLFLIAQHNLSTPIENGWVCGYQVDFHWPDAKLIVEADDRTTHATPIAFERDRERDLTLELAGWHVLRISARQLKLQPDRVAAAIAAKLGLVLSR
jgi:predicted transcriptional regulator of viral defense system